MPFIIDNISIDLNSDQNKCFEKAIHAVGIKECNIKSMWIARKSVDSRDKNNIKLVYSVGFETKDNVSIRVNSRLKELQVYNAVIKKGNEKIVGNPVVAGFGPSGMFCSLMLARNGYKPIILEKGRRMEDRVLSVERFWKCGVLDEFANVQFGEGGAGTFSDGKLMTRISDPRCEFVLHEFVKHGAPDSILYYSKPHIGSDLLRDVVVSIRNEIEELGGEIHFCSSLTGIKKVNSKEFAVLTNKDEIITNCLVLALGHSATESFIMLQKNGIELSCKPFSVGVRIEHLQKDIDFGLYGMNAGNDLLPKGEYQLSQRFDDNSAVYTFCMCPGGLVVPSSSSRGEVVTNGMSYNARNLENANAALVVSVDSRDFGTNPIEALKWQNEIECTAFRDSGSNYSAPIQTVGRFLDYKKGYDLKRIGPSYSLGYSQGSFDDIFNSRICDRLRSGISIFGKRLPGFAAYDAVLTAPETRTSSPIRINRDESGIAFNTDGIYPIGEGAGYAGGIMSSATDGIRTAEHIINRFAPLEQ